MVRDDIPIEVLKQLVEDIQSTPPVDYTGKHGAVCPVCGERKCRVTTSGPWVGVVRERFHVCGRCGLRFKSVEVDG